MTGRSGALLMLYIKNYQALEELIPTGAGIPKAEKHDRLSGFAALLGSLTGQRITVYVDNHPKPFSGVLITASDSLIRLTGCSCSPGRAEKCLRCRNRNGMGVKYEVPVARIRAVFYSTL